ncbi:Type-2 restriction enzyme NgoMIV [subsurface metagenome]
MKIVDLRKTYHARICKEIIRISNSKGVDYPNFADGSSKASRQIALGITERLEYVANHVPVKEQTVGDLFELATRDFLIEAFGLLQHLRPGKWTYATEQTGISNFDQYEHLAYLDKLIEHDKSLKAALGGDYIVKPDIVIGRVAVSDNDLNSKGTIVGKKDSVASHTPLRTINRKGSVPILHASISCKWTIRSDRSQNTRTEALNLIRNRKGHLPHVVAVTAEPLPTRIAALALGTGDIDCVYHFALTELLQTVEEIDNQDQLDILKTMVDGKRLRDISDLPFDLAI